MAEERSMLSNRRDRLNKRRKLNIDNAMQDAKELALNTPKSQRAGDWVGSARDPIVIDLTGCGDTPPATPIPVTPQSEEMSGDEVATCLAHIDMSDQDPQKAAFVQIPRPCLTESAFSGWHPPDTLCSEFDVSKQHSDPNGVQYLDLNDFTIYRPPSDHKRAMEMSTLDGLQITRGIDDLCFSGNLSTATASYYVRNVNFTILAIDGYGDDECTSLCGMICIQSQWARARNI